MKYSILLLSLSMLLTVSACAKRSPEAQKQEAEAEYMKEKTNTLRDYKECVKNSGGADDNMKQCDALLKAVHAVEGTQAPQPIQPATAQPTQSAPAKTTQPAPPGQ